MSTVAFLEALHARGISIDANGGRLMIEAPEGAVTAELRGELLRRKTEIIAALDAVQQRPEASNLIEVQNEVAGLLAIAYRRHSAVQRVGADREAAGADCGLASAGGSSVHGDVP
jgi:hypothetical protein